MNWWLIVLLTLLGLLLVFGILPTLLMSGVIYTVLLVRTKPEKWKRECSIPDDPEYLEMFRQGLDWDAQYASCKRDVGIVNDGLHLYGEYFDFGCKRAVIILPGRMESCLYSYFFAEPFRKSGFNVLVIDNRAHGLSEGKVCSLGFREYRDTLAWCRLLHDTLHNESVVLHGICIGASNALFALTAPTCPDYVTAMSSEGMYTTFDASFRNHMKLDKHPLFPFAAEVMLYIRLFSHANVVTDGPIKRISSMKKPILFLHSKVDQFSLPDKAELLYRKCTSENKQLVWFECGSHSRIRINNPERYDQAIFDFYQALN